MSTNEYQRQDVKGAVVDLTIENMGTGNGYTVKLPPGALLLTVGVLTVTAFDSETTATATVGDGTTTFVNAQDIKTTGNETSANTPKFYPDGGTVTFSLAQTGDDATAGRAIGSLTYLQLGAGGTVYG